MPLTKKQIAQIANLVRQAEEAKAMCLPTIPIPEEIEMDGTIKRGWGYNSYNCSVYEVWQSMHLSYMDDPKKNTRVSASRTIHKLWDSPEKAAIAMIHEIANECAHKLARVYHMAGISLLDSSEISNLLQHLDME